MIKIVVILLGVAAAAFGAPGNRIINGEDATNGDFPWQVSLQRLYNSGYWHFCGGSLISSQYIMSAAHCAQAPALVTVYAGSVDKFNYGVRLEVESFIAHEDYNSNEISWDYGIVKLKYPLDIGSNPNIDTIAIPGDTYDASSEFTGDAIATGWGYNNYNGQNHPSNTLPDILQVANIPVLSDAQCTNYWGSFYQSSNMICAGANREGVCMGDSGGPLTQVINGVTTLIGATSWAPSSCTPLLPSGWAKLSTARSWILQHTDL